MIDFIAMSKLLHSMIENVFFKRCLDAILHVKGSIAHTGWSRLAAQYWYCSDACETLGTYVKSNFEIQFTQFF